jgi:HEAT repeat protein
MQKVRDEHEDLDVRLAAATVLGPLATPANKDVIDALHDAMRDTDAHDVELVWGSALSLAELDQPDIADTILKLLNRQELSTVQVYDRETDPKNPSFRNLNEQEQERILINTMIGVEHYNVPAVQEQLRKLSETDPSSRVRAALKAKAPIDATGAAK